MKNENFSPDNMITIKTGKASYSFTQSWVENKALKDILVDMIAEDYNSRQDEK